MATFSFEEGYGPFVGGNTFVPAKRTNILEETPQPPTSDKHGRLPDDPQLLQTLRDAAKKYNVPEEYALALANQESDYDPQAFNSEFGASGLFQFIPGTAKQKGIDPLDPVQAADAAMADFAARMKVGGVEEAIMSHFAGPGGGNRGKKTQQYLADVQQRASEIRELLKKTGDATQGGNVDPTQKPGKKTFSFEEGYGPNLGSQKPEPEQHEPINAGFGDQAISFLKNSAEAIGDVAESTFNHIMLRLKDKPGYYLGKRLITVERSPEEIERILDNESRLTRFLNSNLLDSEEEYRKGRREALRFVQITEGDDTDLIRKRIEEAKKSGPPMEGFFNNVKNPFDLMLNESLPSNLIQALVNQPELERQKFWKARQVSMQENIVAHPEKFPEVAVQAAQQAIDARKAQQDPGVREMWDQLKAAYKKDPGKFGAQFVNALIADPEMLLAPEGIGLKLIQGMRGAEAATKAVKIADRVIDAGTTGAALNLGIEGAAAAKEGRSLTPTEIGVAVGTGAGISGPIGGFLEAFRRASTTAAKASRGEISESDLEGFMREAAQEEAAAEAAFSSGSTIDRTVKHRIEEVTGIKFESEKDLKAYLQQTRKEWKKLFEERDLNGQYQKFVAEERAAMREASTAAAARQRSIDDAFATRQAERSAQFQREWEQALAARDAAREAGDVSAALKEDALRSATARLDEEEIIAAAWEGSNQVKSAMVRAAQRDSHLRRPKWQRGEVDPRLVTSLGVGSLFAGTAFAIAPEKDKGAAAFAAGLAGLLLPKGGTVLDRLRQSGAVTLEGDIVGLLVSQGKLKVAEAATEHTIRTNGLVEKAKAGDQLAYRDLYNEFYPRIQRYVRQFVREAGPRLGIDSEDVAQEAFIDAFKNLDKFKGEAQFATWLTAIARNKGLEAIRDAQTLKGGGQYKFTSMYSQAGEDAPSDLGAGHLEGGNNPIKGDVEKVAADADTPDALIEREDARAKLEAAIARLPEKRREIFLLNRVEQYTAQQIAEMKGIPLGSVLSDIKRASDFIADRLAKDFGAKKLQALPETQAGVVAEPVKRGRGRPRKQVGEIDPKMLVTLTGAAGTAALAAYLVDSSDGKRSKKTAALGGAALGLLLFGGGAHGFRQAAKMIEDVAGVGSTTLLNNSPRIFRRAQNAERRILEQTHQHITNVDPFLVRLSKLTKEGQQVVTRALLTGNAKVITRILDAIGDKELLSGYKMVRQSLDSLGDQLVELNRFKRGNVEYFPRIVKDREGLFKAIGKDDEANIRDILRKANADSIRKNGRPLTDIEESAIINQALFVDKRSTQPSWAKQRGIEEITPELLPFYATPAESIHSYIRSAVQDIEKAKFFGRYARNMKKGQFEFLDVDRSINNLMAEEIKAGTLTDAQADDIAKVLKARFGKGEHGENDLIRNIKNVGNIGLLGNLWSAANQLADVAVQVHVQGLTPTLRAVVRQLTGRKFIDVKNFGLVDHISEEFAGQLRTTRYLNTIFKYSLFAGMDRFGKNVALNGAIIKGRGLALSDNGVTRLSAKYGEMFGDDFNKLVSDLKAGKVSDLTKEYAWMELSRTQPISRLEMPVAYLNNPNLRTFWWLKSFTVKQFDLLRRDAYNEIRKGNIAKGLKNLTTAGVMMGVGGAGTEMVRNWMLGRDEDFDWGEVPLNMFRNLGFSQYTLDHLTGVSKEEAAARRADGEENVRAIKAKPLEALAGVVAPPYKHFQAILTGDPKAVRYLVPVIGPYLAEKLRNAEIERKKLEKDDD